MRLVLFDIDGTLVSCHGAGGRAMTRAGRDVFDPRFSLEGVDFAGRLDPHIVDEGLARLSLSPSAELHAEFRQRYLDLLEVELMNPRFVVHPGVKELVTALAARDDVVLGLLTGNWGEAAELKLARADIPFERFAIHAFGDHAETRDALAGLALERFRAHAAKEVAPEHVVVIGDTPADVRCARAHGLRMVAVATGRHSVEQLREVGAPIALENLAVHDIVWDLLRA
jgi:phosphoglycolate phosphatase